LQVTENLKKSEITGNNANTCKLIESSSVVSFAWWLNSASTKYKTRPNTKTRNTKQKNNIHNSNRSIIIIIIIIIINNDNKLSFGTTTPYPSPD
jgi:hypothetical protein